MSVCGKYTERFSEATHVVADGHLDDPSFRNVAISRITEYGNGKVTARMGWDERTLPIKRERKGGREYVEIEYRCPLFGPRKTRGWPFIDDSTPVPTTAPKAKEGE